MPRYPTPLPTSSTGIPSSSPPLLPAAQVEPRPGLQRTQSSVSERAPLCAVPSITLPESGEAVLMGRSSNSSHYQLSANRLVSRIHVRAAYVPAALGTNSKIEVICLGWNGVQVQCQGRTWDLAKGDHFTSETEHDVMLDVHHARVLLAWPHRERRGSPSAESDSTGADDDASPCRGLGLSLANRTPSSPVRCGRPPQSPVSPTPAGKRHTTIPPTPALLPSDVAAGQNPVCVYEDEPAEEDHAGIEGTSKDTQSTQLASPAPVGQAASGPSSGRPEPENFSDQDEENDPIICSFGPQGDNILPRMASFTTADSPIGSRRRRRPLDASGPPLPSLSGAADTDPASVANHVINQLAFSRLSSTPLSTIWQNLPAELKQAKDLPGSKTSTKEELETALQNIAAIGKVRREGKDAGGKPLETEYYYLPEMDTDRMRMEAVVNGLQKPGLRACRKQHKAEAYEGRTDELRELNANAWRDHADIPGVQGSLDSSLKKNTAFIKRLRTAITSATLNAFLQEIQTLSLHKYLSEIISACYEGLCKIKSPSDVAAGVEVVSALHQRFGTADFTAPLGWLIGRGMATPEKAQLKTLSAEVKEREEKERLSRQRSLLRVVTELWLVGALRSLSDVNRPEDGGPRGKENAAALAGRTADATKGKAAPNGTRPIDVQDAEPFPLEVLKDLLAQDREHINLSLVNLFVKTYAWDVLGTKPTTPDERKVVTDEAAVNGEALPNDRAGDTADNMPMTPPELQQRFRNVLVRYFDSVQAHLIRDQKSIAGQARRNAEAYVRSGEVFEDRQANYEKQLKAQEKLVADAQTLAHLLGHEMPDLEVDADGAVTANGGVGLVNTTDYLRGQADGPGIWQDEEERRFYENLIDLKERVPGILLEDGKKKKVDGDETAANKTGGATESIDSSAKEKPALDPSVSSEETKMADDDDSSTVIVNKTVGAKVDALLARLPDLVSRDLIDDAAVEFCFLNSKASRNRLIKALQAVPRGRTDLFASYARLTATLGRYMTDIAQGMVSYLDLEFRSLQRRKEKDFLGSARSNNTRYLAELIKFGVIPEHIIFHCLKVSLDDFTRTNIEIMCALLESCGRYLFRNPDTAPRMKSFLETLQRKKAAQHLGQQERMLIENALYYVDPPERMAIEQKQRTPVDLFVRKLMYVDLSKRTYAKILKQLRKLQWGEEEVVTLLHKVFTKPGKAKHSNIHLLAILASALYRYHPDFVIGVVDDLLEYITIGLEQNDFRYSQRRIAEVKYLGELYNYKMVDSPVIFDALYRLVTFGHETGTPKPDRLCVLDLPDDFFRIRLVCILLDTCGMCFDRGAAKKKLEFFLSFFQVRIEARTWCLLFTDWPKYYIYTKATLPMEIDFLIHDTLRLIRPQWQLASDLEDASQKFAEAVLQNYTSQEADKLADAEDSADETSTDGEGDEDESRLPDLEEAHSSSEEIEANAPAETQSADTDEDEQIVVTRPDEERDPEADAEFDRELAKLTAESLDSRKFDRKPLFDVPIPLARNTRDAGLVSPDQAAKGPAMADTMAFSLLTKKGNRQQTRTVELPADSNFAVAMKTQRQAEREEQQRIKDLVLNYDLRDDEHDGDHHSLFGHRPNLITKRHEGADRPGSVLARSDKAGSHRYNQRARKLQMNDMDWYGNGSRS
ncbi:MAG: hypothetical protein M1826_001859 [Phylliscum demangeonii]|nr:MAG: hypothetical protein M1826_001859 [Phylliscum demangeonii]